VELPEASGNTTTTTTTTNNNNNNQACGIFVSKHLGKADTWKIENEMEG
jgi:hypothetical protein